MNPIVTHIGTACCVIEIAGFKILTDPVLDDAGKRYHHGFGAVSKKTSAPTLSNKLLDNIDLILLSHPQHKDNFDQKGRAFAKTVPLILSTKAIEKQFKNGKGLLPWETFEIAINETQTLKITATPCQHHPDWLPEFISGKVIGFLLELSNSTETLYISGDTVYFKGISEISTKFPKITYALIHVGCATVPYLTGGAKYTMDAGGFIKTVQQINPKIAIPIHNEGWSHFKENDKGVRKELEKEDLEMQKKVFFITKGEQASLQDLAMSI